jgi:hypothetical protein
MHVEQVIKANGKIINIMEKVCMNSQMAPYMKESGSIIKWTEPDSTLIQMAESGKENTGKAGSRQKSKSNYSMKNKYK